ncbi:MAG: hypothetical protein IPQ18_10800 [Saprospiraceae bacterium]|nr:hypothetical protein [Saprospiraceae bacterium]
MKWLYDPSANGTHEKVNGQNPSRVNAKEMASTFLAIQMVVTKLNPLKSAWSARTRYSKVLKILMLELPVIMVLPGAS